MAIIQSVSQSILRIIITCWVFVLIAACGQALPDLRRLYSFQASALAREASESQPPVVLLHGAFGSRLMNPETGNEVWPGSLRRILFNDYEAIALPIDPVTLEPMEEGLKVSGVTDRVAGRDFYGQIINVLEEVGGFVRTEPGTRAALGEKRYYVFEYDWRRDNVKSAQALDAYIEQIRQDYNKPDLEVDIIAHSMGGLIARYFVRFGTTDVLNDNRLTVNNHGASHVRRVILLGTPNMGSAVAIRNLIEGMKVGFNRIDTEVLATFPSGYQLLPHVLSKWIITNEGKVLERDQFDSKLWERFEFSIFSPKVEKRILKKFETEEEGKQYLKTLKAYFHKHIERGRRFSWSLTVPVPDHKVEYVVFGGDCNLTPAKILVEEIDGESVVRLYPKDIKNPQPGLDYQRLMLEPGDGTVTKASLLARQTLDPNVPRHEYSFFPLKYPFFLCEDHSRLTGNINFQDNLLHALLSVDEI